jgi:CheY-like chemotaxis protein
MSAPDLGSLHILVVDDEPSVRDALELILTLEGHRVVLACDGLAALALFQSHVAEPWDIVLTDRQMPEMDGLELARRLKSLSPHTPVILVTARPERTADLDAVIEKPFTIKVVTETIHQCIAAARLSSV